MGSSETLRSLIDAGKHGKRLDELSTARVIAKIAQQVHAAQQKAGAGKAIGPIAPAKVAVAPTGTVSLDGGDAPALGYSAPEQVTGGTADRRSDVFSLGVVMWEALTHQRLFEAMNDAAVKAAVKDRAIAPPAEINANVPAELSAICMRALSRSPADRYQSLKAMAVEIEEFLEEAGYADNDTKIAQYIASLAGTRKAAGSIPPVNIPANSPPGQTLPGLPPSPPPAQPTILTDTRAKSVSASGAALAAALANAGSSSAAAAIAGPGGASALPASSPSQTAVGIPPGPAPAPPSAPLTPLPPVLPSGSDSAIKSTISATVPPLVKVATVEAKHETAKPVDAKQDTAKPVDAKQQTAKPVEDTKATLVESTPVALVNAAADALAAAAANGAANIVAPTEAKAGAKPETNGQSTAPAVDAKAPVVEADAKADGKSAPTAATTTDAKTEVKADAKADAKQASKSAADADEDIATRRIEKIPHPASVVTLPGRDSKADVLAGWGWGTDKHDAIAPTGYAGDDEDLDPPRSSNKTLMKLIGGGLAVALLVTIIAFAASGSSSDTDKHRTLARQNQESVAEQARATEPVPTTPEPTAAVGSNVAAPVGSDGSAVGSAVDQAAADKAAADQAAADQAAADKAAADKAAADKAVADQAAADKAVADQAAADKAAADKAAADKAAAEQAKRDEAAAKKAAADQAKLDAAAAKQAEAERRKAEADAKKAADAQRKADAKKAADEAAAKKAEERRLAREEAARKKAEADKTAKVEPKKRTDKATTTPKTVAAADVPAKAVDAEAAYRQGLQAFARGDNQAALASLRSAAAANPSYAPTYRGLGLVYEKMGEKNQARTAYKRYLQLAPTAGDAEIIRGRLERLGS